MFTGLFSWWRSNKIINLFPNPEIPLSSYRWCNSLSLNFSMRVLRLKITSYISAIIFIYGTHQYRRSPVWMSRKFFVEASIRILPWSRLTIWYIIFTNLAKRFSKITFYQSYFFIYYKKSRKKALSFDLIFWEIAPL